MESRSQRLSVSRHHRVELGHRFSPIASLQLAVGVGAWAWFVAISVVVSCLVVPARPAAASVAPSGIQVLVPPTDAPTNRVLDTRTTSPLGARKVLTVTLAGDRAGWIPMSASGAFANLTVIGARKSGFVSIFPAGQARPRTSSINFDTYQSYSNHLLLKIGVGGRVSIYNGSDGPVHVLLDVTGYIVKGASRAPGSAVAIALARVLDTGAGIGVPKGPLPARSRLDVQITGRGGIPSSGVAGVWIHLTVTSPQRSGYVVGWPAGGPRPSVSTVNFVAGQTVANQVFVPLSVTGKLSFANQSDGSIRLVGDVVGYTRAGRVTAEGGLTGIAPRRVLDTQSGIGAVAGPVRSYQALTVQVAGRGGVPLTGARAVLLNVTAASAQTRGFLNVYAGHYCIPPRISRLNFAPGRPTANMVLAPVAPDGTVTIHNAAAGTVRIIADVSGVILGPQAPLGAISVSNGTRSGNPSLSHDGRYVAFGSYIWDSRTRATTAMPDAGRTPFCSYWEAPVGQGDGVLSGDAQYALYFLPETNSNSSSRMYLWKRSDGTSQFVTDQYLGSASITDDGNHVVYTPYEGITDFLEEPRELIRWDRRTAEREVLVRVPEGQSIRGIVSGDGQTIIYESDADAFGSQGAVNVYRWRDGQSDLITGGRFHAVSDDGNTVLLNTATPDGLQLKDLALWSNGTLTVLTPQPVAGYLSGDGQVAAWQQQESSDPNGPWAVYRKEVGKEADPIIRYPTSARATAIALSQDGSRLAYAETTGVFLR